MPDTVEAMLEQRARNSVQDRDEAMEEHHKHMEVLQPIISDIIKQPMGEQARKAQNAAIVLSAVGIVVYFGFVTIGEMETEFGPITVAGKTAGWLFALVAAFFLARFLIVYHEEHYLHGLDRKRAVGKMMLLFSPFDYARAAGNFEERRTSDLKHLDISHKEAYAAIQTFQRLNKARAAIDLVFPILIVAALWGSLLLIEPSGIAAK